MAGATKLWGGQGPSALDDGSFRPGEGNKVESAKISQLLTCKGAWIGVLLFVAQQLSGINAVVYFSSATFAEVSFERCTPCRSVATGLSIDPVKQSGLNLL